MFGSDTLDCWLDGRRLPGSISLGGDEEVSKAEDAEPGPRDIEGDSAIRSRGENPSVLGVNGVVIEIRGVLDALVMVVVGPPPPKSPSSSSPSKASNESCAAVYKFSLSEGEGEIFGDGGLENSAFARLDMTKVVTPAVAPSPWVIDPLCIELKLWCAGSD